MKTKNTNRTKLLAYLAIYKIVDMLLLTGAIAAGISVAAFLIVWRAKEYGW
jgi:hypothetical protein